MDGPSDAVIDDQVLVIQEAPTEREETEVGELIGVGTEALFIGGNLPDEKIPRAIYQPYRRKEPVGATAPIKPLAPATRPGNPPPIAGGSDGRAARQISTKTPRQFARQKPENRPNPPNPCEQLGQISPRPQTSEFMRKLFTAREMPLSVLVSINITQYMSYKIDIW